MPDRRSACGGSAGIRAVHFFLALGNGVIGNTAVSGTVIQGSSPCSPTN